jgi:hypothetical protein
MLSKIKNTIRFHTSDDAFRAMRLVLTYDSMFDLKVISPYMRGANYAVHDAEWHIPYGDAVPFVDFYTTGCPAYDIFTDLTHLIHAPITVYAETVATDGTTQPFAKIDVSEHGKHIAYADTGKRKIPAIAWDYE